MRRFEIHRRGAIVIKCAFPSRDAYTPFIARLESGKTPLRMWRDEIVSIQDGKIQELLCDFARKPCAGLHPPAPFDNNHRDKIQSSDRDNNISTLSLKHSSA